MQLKDVYALYALTQQKIETRYQTTHLTFDNYLVFNMTYLALFWLVITYINKRMSFFFNSFAIYDISSFSWAGDPAQYVKTVKKGHVWEKT